MPSFWSSVANSAWNTRRSKRTPSASVVSNARLTLPSPHRPTAATAGDGLGDLHRLVHQARRRHHARDQARALGLGRIHHAAGQDQIHRLGLADRAGQPLRAADARDDAELDLRLAELGVVGGDDDVALHRELAAAAERKARDRRDHRLARARDAVLVAGEVADD